MNKLIESNYHCIIFMHGKRVAWVVWGISWLMHSINQLGINPRHKYVTIRFSETRLGLGWDNVVVIITV